jgi:hypothetical protein
MKKLTVIIVLIMVALMATPGYADLEGFKKFVNEVKAQEKESGRPEISVQSEACIIIIFGLQQVMRKFRYHKTTDTYEIKDIKKIDTAPSDWDQTPQERLREALAIYGIEKTTE